MYTYICTIWSYKYIYICANNHLGNIKPKYMSFGISSSKNSKFAMSLFWSPYTLPTESLLATNMCNIVAIASTGYKNSTRCNLDICYTVQKYNMDLTMIYTCSKKKPCQALGLNKIITGNICCTLYDAKIFEPEQRPTQKNTMNTSLPTTIFQGLC